MSDLAERFRELRRQRGLTSTAVAQPRYSVSYVSQIERGFRHPSPVALRYFAERLGVSVAYLQTGVPDDLRPRLYHQMRQAEREMAQDRPQEAAAIMGEVVEQTELYDVGALRGTALCTLGDALYQSTRYRESRRAYERALEIELGRPDLVRATVGLARACRAMGDLRRGVEVVDSLLRSKPEPPLDPVAVIQLQTVLVSLYFERGDILQAERAAERAMAAVDAGTPPRIEAQMWWNVSRVLAERDRLDEALDAHQRARLLLEGLSNRHDQANLHVASAFLCLEAEPPLLEEAELHLDRAEELFDQIQVSSDRAFAHTERSRLSFLQGRYEESLAHAERAMSTDGVQELERARALYAKGRSLAALGRQDEAREAFDRAASIFEAQGAKGDLASTLRQIGELSATVGEFLEAIESYRAAFDALEPLGLRPYATTSATGTTRSAPAISLVGA